MTFAAAPVLPDEQLLDASHGFKAHVPSGNGYKRVAGATQLPHVESTAALLTEFGGASPAFHPEEKRDAIVHIFDPATGQETSHVVKAPPRKTPLPRIGHEGVQIGLTGMEEKPSAAAQPGPSPDAAFESTLSPQWQPTPPQDPFLQTPVPAPAYPQNPAPQYPPPPNPLLAEIARLQAQLAALQQPQQPSPQSQEQAATYREVAEFLRKQKETQAAEKADAPARLTYEEIGLPWAGKGEPLKPERTALFFMSHGTLRAKYHAIAPVNHGGGMVLVIDDRYKDELFLPAVSKEPVRVTVKSGNPEQPDLDMQVCNPDFSFTVGAFSYVALVRWQPPEEEPEEEE